MSEIAVTPDGEEAEHGVVAIADGEYTYKFRYNSGKERRRATRLFEKEPGTVEWIRTQLQPEDVLYDIGANVGVYSILAGCRMSSKGRVYCFEPHIPNAASLLENIFLNNIQDRAQLINLPLTETEGFDSFNYFSMLAGSSTSQLGRTVSDSEEFTPACSEIKYGVAIDTLLERGLIENPDMIKIDVDGLELLILSGMKRLLHGDSKPRSVQCEVSAESHDAIVGFFSDAGYALKHKHWTKAGMDAMASGEVEGEYPIYCAIFDAER